MIPMIDCDTVMRQLWDYLDRELTAERMATIEEHLKVCGRCQPHAAFETSFLAALAMARREHSGTERLSERVRAALKARG